jgi:hypothetical protein
MRFLVLLTRSSCFRKENLMKVRTPLAWLTGVALAIMFAALAGLAVADPPEAPPVSKLCSADDLVAQLDEYVEELEESVENEDEYNDSKEKLGKDLNTLILIAVGLGLHDEDNKYKAAAPALVKAAQEATATEDYGSAKAAVEAVKAALESKGDPSGVSWDKKNASLPELMKAVPLVNTRLKRYMRRFERGAEDVAGYAGVIAVIAQGSMPNADETELPDEVEKWHQYCIQMRDAAAALNQAARATDEDAAKAAMDALQKSCDDCHAVFHEDED